MAKNSVQRNSFMFYRSYFEIIQVLEPQDQIVLLKAIAKYSLDGKEPNLKGLLKAIFIIVKPQIDINQKKYESGCKGGKHGKLGSKHGKLGGKPKNKK